MRRAVEAEIADRVAEFASGVVRYQSAPIQNHDNDWQMVWRDGTTSLKRLPGDGVPILLVPSLINRAYILDFLPGQSLAQYLQKMGHAVYLLDWDAPGPDEQNFTLDDYVARLVSALDTVDDREQQPVRLLGYCMGGLLALAAYMHRKAIVSQLLLLATPWDFAVTPAASKVALRALSPVLTAMIAKSGALSVDMLQAMFLSADPLLALRRFRDFDGYPPASARLQQFVALQDWLNDGVPLVGRVANECLHAWYLENRPHDGLWQSGGEPVRPAAVTCPMLIAVPKEDTVVAPASARAICEQVPHADVLDIGAGHIGMVAGRTAHKKLYMPLQAWLDCH